MHAASPSVTAPMADLVAVNYGALKALADRGAAEAVGAAGRPRVLLSSSRAVELALPGWEAYAGAKSMATSLVNGIERRHAGFGVRGLTLSPGLVATPVSPPTSAATPVPAAGGGCGGSGVDGW